MLRVLIRLLLVDLATTISTTEVFAQITPRGEPFQVQSLAGPLADDVALQ